MTDIWRIDREAAARAIMHRNRDYGMDPFPEDATPSDYETSMAKAAPSVTAAREAKLVEALEQIKELIDVASGHRRRLTNQIHEIARQALAGGA